MKDELRRLVASAAPNLAQALGGPLAGLAVREIGSRVFGIEDADLAAVESALQRPSTEDLMKLREADAKFRAEITKAGVELERVAMEDRDSARDRQVELRDWTPSILGALILCGFFGVLAALMFFDLPEGAADVFKIMVGAMGAMTTQVGNYFFGSSAGSAAKNGMLERLSRRDPLSRSETIPPARPNPQPDHLY